MFMASGYFLIISIDQCALIAKNDGIYKTDILSL